MRDLHELPKLRDGLSYLYLERGRVEQKYKAVEFVNKEGRTMIPAAALAVLMLGPGTVITHAAVKALADNGCLVVWCGEDGTRCYAQGGGETRRAYHLLKQAELASDPQKRLQVVLRMYRHRFGQQLQPGLSLQKAWEAAEELDNGLEQSLSYAFSSKLGYLTACPSNVGTGMRASVMLHLPGLVLTEEINPVINAVSKIGLAVRGLWGEGSEASGNMFQISNQITLGRPEAEIISHLEQIVLEVIEHETNARQRLMDEQELRVHDHVGRAYGVLANAALMTSGEALDLLSALRLGIDLEMLPDMARREIDRLFIQIHPAHLQKAAGATLSPEERDVKRAQLVRQFLEGK